jgi:hypothetical protein
MTDGIFYQEQAEFARLEVVRLLDPNQGFPPFEGPWAEALVALLQRKYQPHMPVTDSLLNQVMACFLVVDDEPSLKSLWVALSESMEKPGPQNEHDESWLMALVAFATLLTMDRAQWATLKGNSDNGAGAYRSGLAPTEHLGIAAAAFTRLVLGARFEGLAKGEDVHWIEIDISANQRTDLEAAILAAYLWEIKRSKGGAPDPTARNANASMDDLLTQLAAQSQRKDFYNIGSGIGIRKPAELTNELWEATLVQLADRLQTHVVGLAAENTASSGRLVRSGHATHYKLLSFYLDKAQACIKHSSPSKGRSSVGAADPAKAWTTKPPPIAEAPTTMYAFDFFLSHASEDKAPFVDDLAGALQDRGWSVWYDKEQMGVGSNLLKELEDGLKQSHFAVLIISPHSINKPSWVAAEWEAVLGRDISEGKPRILPILLNLSFADLQKSHPFLARLLAVNASQGVRHVVEALERAVARIQRADGSAR